MRALTILAPYPTLICLPDSDPRHKRVENRIWRTSYRGPLAIHCGASNKLMRGGTMRQVEFALFGERFPWLKGHRHIEGPICWILENVRVLKSPIPWKGAQGLWEVPDQVIERQLEDA